MAKVFDIECRTVEHDNRHRFVNRQWPKVYEVIDKCRCESVRLIAKTMVKVCVSCSSGRLC